MKVIWYCFVKFLLQFIRKLILFLQVSTLRDWLNISKNTRGMSDHEVLMIMMELNSNGVAIKGSKVFSVSFSLVANVRTT